MPKSREIAKREVYSTVCGVDHSVRTPSRTPTNSGTPTPGGGAIDWKKKYKDEFDKRFALEEQYDDLQTQVINCP